MSRLEHFQKYQLAYELSIIVSLFMLQSIILASSVIMEAQRRADESSFLLWQPFVWELSSAFATLSLLPAISCLLRRINLNWRTLMIYLGASLLFSLSHVAIMVALRKVVYWSQSLVYDFGDTYFELIYEYRKDLWSFILIIAVFKLYQYVLSQTGGEVQEPNIEPTDTKQPRIQRLVIKKLGKEFIVDVVDIEWLESCGNYVNLHSQGRIYPMRTTLGSLITQLSAQGFSRIHRSYAINIAKLTSIETQSSGDSIITLDNGKELNLSRRYKAQFKQRL